MSDGEADSQYNDTNRAFIQAFLSHSVLTLKEAKPILAGIFTAHGKSHPYSCRNPPLQKTNSPAHTTEDRETLPEDVTEADFNRYLSAANRALTTFDLEIRSSLSQADKTRIYALVNTTSDAMTQLATTHTADEISFVKRVLDAIFETFNTQRQEVCAVTSMQAVRLHKNPVENDGRGGEETPGGAASSSGNGLSMVQAERLMTSLVEEGWFDKSKAGFFSLSARGLMELRGWLLETYNEAEEEDEGRGERVKLCFACKEIITVGQRCSNRQCLCRLHDICTGSFFRTQREKKCPICKAEWTGKDFVGEKAVTTTEAYQQGRRRSGVASSQARRSTQGGRDAEMVNGTQDG